ncbi:MAG: M17 family peptidase N-terminal domain-containing protein, partial [Marmoricola sp.]
MTTYTRRKGNPATTRTDVVVVAVGTADGGGPEVASGGEPIAEAYGRRLGPLLASLGFQGKAGEALRVPAGETVRPGSVLFVGVGALDRCDATALRRAAGVAARNLGNAS